MRVRAIWMLPLVVFLGACDKKEPAETRTDPDTAAVDARPGMLPVPGGSLERGPWRWVLTVTPVERIIPPDPSRYTLEFLPDSLVSAQVDCNRGSGAYHLDGRSIRIGPLATTRMMCPPGSMDTRFAQQLDAARGWFMQGDTLMLDLFADSGTMRFVR